jgi:conjugal transfer pilus assembly protein TraF
MDKSSLFADVARRVVWTYPDVNYSARSPTVNYARANVKGRVDKQRKENIRELAQTHAILFFARSDCDFCHDQAPVLKTFSNNTGMQVLTISLDGGQIPMFPDAKLDNGISLMATGGNGISTVPALFLINRETHETIPLSTGVVAAEEIAERIRVLTLTTPGQEF